MKTRYGVVGVLALAVAAALGTGVSPAHQGAAEKAGERLDEAGRAIKRGLQNAGEKVREGFAKTRTSVHDMGVLSRVYSRLHWDKALTTSLLEVDVQAGGITTLRGSVPDAASKAKAVALTKDTVGVTQVIDQLTVLPPPRTVPAASTTPPTP
ncbi:MAG: BON domain-containing protein [Isosphaeraceae bacterium]|nr:BON domain-containing protein [Isosphaeraceae bacterium]